MARRGTYYLSWGGSGEGIGFLSFRLGFNSPPLHCFNEAIFMQLQLPLILQAFGAIPVLQETKNCHFCAQIVNLGLHIRKST